MKFTIEQAIRLIERGATEWYDFCAYYGHISGNVSHMWGIRRAFLAYLEENYGGKG